MLHREAAFETTFKLALKELVGRNRINECGNDIDKEGTETKKKTETMTKARKTCRLACVGGNITVKHESEERLVFLSVCETHCGYTRQFDEDICSFFIFHFRKTIRFENFELLE